MLLDYPSLLVSIGFSAVCLGVVLFTSWITMRADSFLLACAIAAGFIVAFVFAYSFYIEMPRPPIAAAAFSLLLAALSVLYGAARQFRLGVSPLPRAATAFAITCVLTLPPIMIGYDGVGIALVNLACAMLLFLTALEYWQGRDEAPSAIACICGLYVLVGVSFALCTVALALEGRLVLDGPPSNWAEDINLIAVIAGVPGIGAMSLALNQTRLARAHRHEAMTDGLTGLLNRRALFDALGQEVLRNHVAVILFDIDRFKGVNDRFGHAAGDRVIAQFAQALREDVEIEGIAARLGGEEFALVLPQASADLALRCAESVRARFAALTLANGGFACTVSAGIAFGDPHGARFEAVVRAADEALYQAKRGGRDRIVAAGPRLVDIGSVRPQPSSRP
ncbi:GGDEF domain-containing protein [Bosea sp. 117]|uniref:GGDEF domain-containing protein n=1 Tax=Bosea sp. 117 TaxID=1125973 RepID=UPI0004946829|nr:GGDEF domain-containing protein [Bosea sp. 117]